MNPSFAQFRCLLNAAAIALAVGGCASLPPPTSELSAAQQALNRAAGADADQYAADAVTQSRSELGRAQAAMAAGKQDDARALALAAAADADLAYADSRAQVTQQEYGQRRGEVTQLRQRLKVDDGPLPQAMADIGLPSPPAPGSEALRLQSLDGDPSLQGFAAYERLQARQALGALLEAKKRDRPNAQYVASRRVAIAELAARTEAMRREVDRMDRDRSDLLVEASRQDAERARRESERLRVQAQIQAEETQRLREAAEEASTARQQAEDLIIDVGGAEAQKLKAARAREAELARQEAELMSEGRDDPDAGAPARPKRKP